MSSTPIKVSVITRLLAKTVDIFVLFFVSFLLPLPLGVMVGLVYILVHDALPGSQSLGKKLFKLKVVVLPNHQECTYRHSVIRNAPLGVATFFAIIPFWGWLIALFLGIPMIFIEIYLIFTKPLGERLGDVMADTLVQNK